MSIDTPPIPAVRTIGGTGRTSEIRAETHGECSGHEAGEPGEYEHVRADAGAGESLADPG